MFRMRRASSSVQASKLREAIPCDQMLALADGVRAAKKAARHARTRRAPNSELSPEIGEAWSRPDRSAAGQARESLDVLKSHG